MDDLKRRHRITEILMEIGVVPSNVGFDYLRDNIVMYMALTGRERIHWAGKTRRRVAVMHDTTERRVERCERHAMTVAIDNCPPDVEQKYFHNCVNYESGVPSLREFIAMVAKFVEMEEEREAKN